jgi:hypothetical protein
MGLGGVLLRVVSENMQDVLAVHGGLEKGSEIRKSADGLLGLDEARGSGR